jgi:hypothetical protein
MNYYDLPDSRQWAMAAEVSRRWHQAFLREGRLSEARTMEIVNEVLGEGTKTHG